MSKVVKLEVPCAAAREVTRRSFRRMKRFEASKPRTARAPSKLGIVPKWARPDWLAKYRARRALAEAREAARIAARKAAAEKAAKEKKAGVLAKARKKLKGGVKQTEKA